jgi:hypothetical protein
MKHITKISWLLIAFSLFGLSACGGGSAAATPTVDTIPIYTQIASTALALQTQTVLAMPTSTNTPQISSTPEETNTPLITDTPLPSKASATPLTLTTPLATSPASCDNMVGVADVTIPDGYVAAPGEVMKKTWTVKNLGPCTWNQHYVLIYGWGGQGTGWNTTKPVNLSKVVAPGETIDISVTLKAPTASGEYVAAFRLQNDKGFNFGPPQTIVITVK